jgi:hypothetical protein
VGGGRVGGATGACWSSRGCSHRPAASRPARATIATKAADSERWGRAKAVHLRAHLPPGTDQTRDLGDQFTSAAAGAQLNRTQRSCGQTTIMRPTGRRGPDGQDRGPLSGHGSDRRGDAVALGSPRFARPGYCSTSLRTCAMSSARRSPSGSCSCRRLSASRMTSAAVMETPSSCAFAATRRIHSCCSAVSDVVTLW